MASSMLEVNNQMMQDLFPELKKQGKRPQAFRVFLDFPQVIQEFISQLYKTYYENAELSEQERIGKLLVPFVVGSFFEDQILFSQMRLEFNEMALPPVKIPGSFGSQKEKIRHLQQKIERAEMVSEGWSSTPGPFFQKGRFAFLKSHARSYVVEAPDSEKNTKFIEILRAFTGG